MLNTKLDNGTGKKGIAVEDNVEEIVEKECIAEEFEMSIKEVKGAPAENPCETPFKAPLKFMKDQEQQIADPEIQVTDVSTMS